ncbi:MAG: MgtC/SapB family protein [Clostridia bacterium]|nr:MgtC/SapB family protein [Clostridia bacterium]
MFDLQQAEYILRICIAGVCGIVVGLERKNRSKEAGIRTHFVVACGAALIMVISKYAFFDVIQSSANSGVDVRLDPSRVASTIASGIGFLGAGMIFVHRNTISGLTTAAGIWATSGIGMAIGAGLYVLGVSATFLILFAQLFLHLKLFRNKNIRVMKLSIRDVSENGYQKKMAEEFQRLGIAVQTVSIETLEDKQAKNYAFTIELPEELEEEELINSITYPCSIKSAL